MRLLARRRRADRDVAAPEALEDFDGTLEELRAEAGRLTARNREDRDPAAERRLMRLRHIAGRRLVQAAGRRPDHPEPDRGRLPDTGALPELSPAEVTPGLLRAATLRDGCALVRGLVDREAA